MQIGEVPGRAQVRSRVQDLRWTETSRRHRFVADEQEGMVDSAGDGDPLALAAGKAAG